MCRPSGVTRLAWSLVYHASPSQLRREGSKKLGSLKLLLPEIAVIANCRIEIADVIRHSNIVLHLRYVRILLAHLRLILFFLICFSECQAELACKIMLEKTILLFRYRTGIYLSKY